MSIYYRKYIKYKTKYLRSSNGFIGGNDNLVIHISGASGSGKTTLGNKLKEKFGDKIIVKDFDELFNQFMQDNKYEWGYQFDPVIYQTYLDNFINKQTKPLILVGLNLDMWHNPYHYYDSRANYKFYIDIETCVILKQKLFRAFDTCFYDYFKENKNKIFNDLLVNEDDAIKDVVNIVSGNLKLSKMRTEIDEWNRDYQKMNYQFMTRENIFDEVSNILDNIS